MPRSNPFQRARSTTRSSTPLNPNKLSRETKLAQASGVRQGQPRRVIHPSSSQPLDSISRQFGAQSFAGMSTLPGELSGQQKASRLRGAGLLDDSRIGGGRAGRPSRQPQQRTSSPTRFKTPATSGPFGQILNFDEKEFQRRAQAAAKIGFTEGLERETRQAGQQFARSQSQQREGQAFSEFKKRRSQELFEAESGKLGEMKARLEKQRGDIAARGGGDFGLGFGRISEDFARNFRQLESNIKRLESGKPTIGLRKVRDSSTRSGFSIESVDPLSEDRMREEFESSQEALSAREESGRQTARDIELGEQRGREQAQIAGGRATAQLGGKAEPSEIFRQRQQDLSDGLDEKESFQLDSAINQLQTGDESELSQFMQLYQLLNQQQAQRDEERRQTRQLELQQERDKIEEQKNARSAQLKAEANQLKAEARSQRNEAIDRAKSRLNASGRLTTDESGNLDAEAVALLNTIESEWNDTYNDRVQEIDNSVQSAISQFDQMMFQAELKSDAEMRQFDDQIAISQQKRSDAFQSTMLNAMIKQITDKKNKEFQALQTKGGQFFVFDKQTGQITEAPVGSPQYIDGSQKLGALIQEFDVATPTRKSEIIQNLSSTGMLDQFNKMRDGEIEEAFEYDSLAMSVLPGTIRNSNVELQRYLNGFKLFRKKGINHYEAADRMLGFRLDDDVSALGQGLRLLYTSSQKSDTARLADLGRLLNSKTDLGTQNAITLVENTKLSDVPQGGGIRSGVLARETLIKASRASELIKKLKKTGKWDEVTGLFDSFSFRMEAVTPDLARQEHIQLANELSGLLVGLTAPYRQQNAGSNVTESETRWLEPLIASLSNQPEIFEGKLNQFVLNVMDSHNAARMSVGLPMLNGRQFVDFDERTKVYVPIGERFLEQKKEGVEIKGETDTSSAVTLPDTFGVQDSPRRMRTDRHNNPTAFTTQIAKQAGLVEGVDYEMGDAFPDNDNFFTARILKDPIETTLKVIDKIGFFTLSGAPRWSYFAMTEDQWKKLSRKEKIKTIFDMYQQEGGTELTTLF